MRSCRSRSLVSRAVYMSSMLPTLSFTFIEAGASLVCQLAGLPVGAEAWPRGVRTVRVRVARAGPDAVAPEASCRLVFVAGGAVSGGMSGVEAAKWPRALV